MGNIMRCLHQLSYGVILLQSDSILLPEKHDNVSFENTMYKKRTNTNSKLN